MGQMASQILASRILLMELPGLSHSLGVRCLMSVEQSHGMEQDGSLEVVHQELRSHIPTMESTGLRLMGGISCLQAVWQWLGMEQDG
jgi:hypothetical protein